jgi:hypothetical protein
MKVRIILGIVFFSSLQLVSAARGASIGVNFTATNFGGGPYPILAHESAGLAPQINWNNTIPLAGGTTAQIAGPIPGSLVDDSGAVTPAQMVWANGNSAVNSDGGNLTPNERLYRGTVEGPGSKLPAPQLIVTAFNIPYPQYDVIVYLAGFGFGADASVKLGSEEYFYVQSSNFTTDGFVQATATTYEDRQLATYAVFRNLTQNFFFLEMIKQDGNRAAIAGFQIIAVPEPSAAALLAIGGALLLMKWRRWKVAG